MYGINNYNPSTGNGIGWGSAPTWAGPGVCGDPYQGMASAFAANPTAIQVTYTAGQTINLEVRLNVNHGGRFGFKLCNRRTGIDQACFNQYPLVRADNGKRFYYILTGSFNEKSATSPRVFNLSYKLPAGVVCDGGCVLQW